MSTIPLISTPSIVYTPKNNSPTRSLSPNSAAMIKTLPKWAIDDFNQIQKDILFNNGKLWSIKLEEDDTYHIISRCDDTVRHDLLSQNNHAYYYLPK
jgi:hypothetical protein